MKARFRLWQALQALLLSLMTGQTALPSPPFSRNEVELDWDFASSKPVFLIEIFSETVKVDEELLVQREFLKPQLVRLHLPGDGHRDCMAIEILAHLPEPSWQASLSQIASCRPIKRSKSGGVILNVEGLVTDLRQQMIVSPDIAGDVLSALETVTPLQRGVVSDLDMRGPHSFTYTLWSEVRARSPYHETRKPLRLQVRMGPYEPAALRLRSLSPRASRLSFLELSKVALPQAGRVRGGAVRPLATRPLDSDLVFHISSESSEQLKSAARHAINYWNRAFGRDRIVLREATTMNSIYQTPNQISLVDTAHQPSLTGLGYSSVSASPLDGSISNSLVAVNGALVWYDRTDLLVFLKKFYTLPAQAEKLRRHRQPVDQQVNFAAGSLFNAVASLADERNVPAYSRLLLTSVLAHEIGHTLGLRHNFASHLANDMPVEEWKNLLAKVFLNPDSCDLGEPKPIYSVMGYSTIEEAILIGAQIERGATYAYDRDALAQLYQGSEVKAQPFCPDGMVGYYLDCGRYHTFRNPLKDYMLNTDSIMQSLPWRVLIDLIFAKSHPIQAERKSVDRLSDEQYMDQIVEADAALKLFFKPNGSFFSQVVSQARRQDGEDYRRTLVAEIQGVSGLIEALSFAVAPYSGGPALAWQEHFKVLLESLPSLLPNGIASDYGPLTEDDLADIRRAAVKMFEKLEFLLLKHRIAALMELNDSEHSEFQLYGTLSQSDLVRLGSLLEKNDFFRRLPPRQKTELRSGLAQIIK